MQKRSKSHGEGRAPAKLPINRSLRKLFGRPLDRLLTPDAMAKAGTPAGGDATGVFAACLEALRVRCAINDDDVAKIPHNGPVVIVAKAPRGGVEAFVLGQVLSRVRGDFRFFGNPQLSRVPALGPWLFGGAGAASAEGGSLAEAVAWLKQGGAVVCFPASDAAPGSAPGRKRGRAWGRHAAALLRQTKCPALPVHFPGRGNYLFQAVGLLQRKLHSVLIPRDTGHHRQRDIEVRIGKIVPWRRLEGLAGDGEVTDYLRVHAHFLRHRAKSRRRSARVKLPLPRRRRQQPVIEAVPTEVLVAEVAALPADRRFVDAGDYQVYCCTAAEIPHTLREIGRLREVTFRAAQEGTGKALDLDRFDQYYLHLFIWNQAAREVVGAYRLGLVDVIRERFGAKGLYTRTLFRFKRGFLAKLGPALEVGRSFVRLEYQRKPTCLSLLWRGISEYVVRHPQYRRLIGPVSISHDYRKASKDLIVRYLRQSLTDPEMARYVKPRNPYRGGPRKALDRRSIHSLIKDISDVSLLVSGIEKDGKGVPVLLRYYLDLSATLLSFNVDKDFSDTLDGLVLVDVLRTDPKLLSRFMGADGVKSVYVYHGLPPPPELSGRP